MERLIFMNGVPVEVLHERIAPHSLVHVVIPAHFDAEQVKSWLTHLSGSMPSCVVFATVPGVSIQTIGLDELKLLVSKIEDAGRVM